MTNGSESQSIVRRANLLAITEIAALLAVRYIPSMEHIDSKYSLDTQELLERSCKALFITVVNAREGVSIRDAALACTTLACAPALTRESRFSQAWHSESRSMMKPVGATRRALP
jgi:RNase P subunit RPR2